MRDCPLKGAKSGKSGVEIARSNAPFSIDKNGAIYYNISYNYKIGKVA